MNKILKILLVVSIVAFAVLNTASSCEIKVPKTSGNNQTNNSDTNTNTGCPDICPSTNLIFAFPFSRAMSKVVDNTIYIDASHFNARPNALSSTADNGRGFYDDDAKWVEVFRIIYPGATTGGLVLVNRTHVTKDTITMEPSSTSIGHGCSDSETSENNMAARPQGAHCRQFNNPGGSTIWIDSYLGTVFNNTNTTTHARGTFGCQNELPLQGGGLGSFGSACHIIPVNNGLGANVTINNAWVTDNASTTEAEFYAIGIDLSGKTFSEYTGEAGYGRDQFLEAHDNARMKKLLRNNKWGELKFKVKIVDSTTFGTLPALPTP